MKKLLMVMFAGILLGGTINYYAGPRKIVEIEVPGPPRMFEVVKEVRVDHYDFSQDKEAMQLYANMMGLELIPKGTSQNAWQRGYEDGYRGGRRAQ